MDFTLKNKTDIGGTHWIEFNISRTATVYKCWADNSKYLDENAYNFYTDIFEKAAKDFNYYGDTQFDKEELIKLKQEIVSRIKVVDSLLTLKDITEFSEKTSYALKLTQDIEEAFKQHGQPNKIVDNLKKLGNDLLLLVDICLIEGKILMVLGL